MTSTHEDAFTRKLSRATLVGGAILIFASWLLMPDAATNDAAHILAAVSAARAQVHVSSLLQLAGAALLLPALVGELLVARVPVPGRLVMAWGAMGLATDAVFHQLAYAMTMPEISAVAMLPVMNRMQTSELLPHVPLLLAFLVSAPLIGWQLRRREGPSWTARLLLAPLVTLVVSVPAVRLASLPRRIAALTILAEICAGLVALGLGRTRD